MKTEKDRRIPDPLNDPNDGHILSRAIIDTIHEPLIILDKDLQVITASRSFYDTYGGDHEKTYCQLFYKINNGQWDIPKFKELLEKIIPEHAIIEEYEIEHNFPTLGTRTLSINAREVHYQNRRKKILISIFDITRQRIIESEKEKLIIQKDLLLKEMRHRVANSLQLIASILLIKAGIVESEETRLHLQDAHERIMSIATVQHQLDPTDFGAEIPVAAYLEALCGSLARSMIGGRKPISLEVRATPGTVTSEVAISLGLVTTELVINAIKHAFPNNRMGKILVMYEALESMWTLSVTDNGIGQPKNKTSDQNGLGTSIITALADQRHNYIIYLCWHIN
ncbi:MAG: sensor histidine kinase [bacterium]|nr:sensor histidine kinase [bacterium]